MQVLVAMGSNLGDRVSHLRAAVADLSRAPGIEVLASSTVFETEAVGGPTQPDFANAALLLESQLDPAALLALLQRIESAHGRVREVHWGPRTLDLDIVDVAGYSSDDPELTVPHPLATQREFVLRPCAEVAPDWVIAGRTLTDWVAALPVAAVRQLAGQLK